MNLNLFFRWNKLDLSFLSAAHSSYCSIMIKTTSFMLPVGKMAGGTLRLYCLKAAKLPYLLVTKMFAFWLTN